MRLIKDQVIEVEHLFGPKRDELAIDEPLCGDHSATCTEERMSTPVPHKDRLLGGQGDVMFGPGMAKRAGADVYRPASAAPPVHGAKRCRTAVTSDDPRTGTQIAHARLAVESEDDAVGAQAACFHCGH